MWHHIVISIIGWVGGWCACAILSMNTRTKERTCAWVFQGDFWDTDCGIVGRFPYGNVEAEQFLYCHKCGGLIIEDKGEAEDE